MGFELLAFNREGIVDKIEKIARVESEKPPVQTRASYDQDFSSSA